MFLSIIIPIYNDEKFLEECLDSCLRQDIPYDDYEIICVDDGSTDRTPEMLKAYAEKYPNIRLMMMERHQGGRTVGLMQARGDYVWFVDHDDLVEENILSAMKRQLTENPCTRLTFPYYEFYGSLTEDERKRKAERSLAPNSSGGKYYSAMIWNAVFNRSFLLQHEIWPRSKWVEGLRPFWSGDTFFTFEASITDGYKEIKWGEHPCYYYRRHPGGQTGATDPKKPAGVLNYATGALRAAVDSREKMLEARSRGADPAPHALRMLIWMRLANVTISTLPKAQWKEGKNRIKAAGMHRVKHPPEYRPIYQSYLKSSGQKTGLKSYLSFLAYHLTAAKLLRIIDVKTSISRFIDNHPALRKWNKRRHMAVDRAKGLCGAKKM